jgi:hypothetical protein
MKPERKSVTDRRKGSAQSPGNGARLNQRQVDAILIRWDKETRSRVSYLAWYLEHPDAILTCAK